MANNHAQTRFLIKETKSLALKNKENGRSAKKSERNLAVTFLADWSLKLYTLNSR